MIDEDASETELSPFMGKLLSSGIFAAIILTVIVGIDDPNHLRDHQPRHSVVEQNASSCTKDS